MLRRLPQFQEILPVYAVTLSMIYGWTAVAFLWKLPSWLHYLTLGEILVIYSYSILTNFFESLAVIALLVLLCVVLPPRILLDKFVVRGSLIAFCVLGGLMGWLSFYTNAKSTMIGPFSGWLVIIVAASAVFAVLSFLSEKVRRARLAIVWISDQLVVFPYLLAPISILALLVVAIRNLF